MFIYNRNKTAVSYKGKDYSYYDIIKMAKIYAEELEIGKGDRVAIFMENRAEYPVTVLSVWEKKGTCTNLDAGYDKEQLAYVFEDSHPKYIYVSNETLKIAEEAKELAKSDVIILNVENISVEKDIEIEKEEIEALDSDDIAVMLYTSGTTGNPKGVMLTFNNLMSNIEAISEIKLVTPEDRMLALLPFHHVLPLVLTMIMPLYFGLSLAILDELSSDSIKAHLKEYKITIVVGVPRVWEMFHKGIMNKIKASSASLKMFNLCKKVKSETLSKIIFKKIHEAFGGHIRILVSGGAKLDKEITEDFGTFGIKVLEGYGLTETSPIISFNRPGNIIAGTVGVPLPGVTVRLSEEDGEILVNGRNVMKGYYNKPEATEEVIDKDGWFHTGDIGQFDGDHLKIIGRKKEMIVLSNGKNINPSDIESEIFRLTDLIEEVAITENEKNLIAIVYPNFKVLEERQISNVKDAIKWDVIDKYNISAPKYKKILDIVIVKGELPKTKLGKLRRFMLKDLIQEVETSASTDGKVEAKVEKKIEKKETTSKYINTKEFEEISKFILSLHGDVEIIPESHLEIDLGLDSLDMVEIITFVEKTFGIQLQETDFIKIKTVEDLCVFIIEAGGNYSESEINWKKILDEPIDIELPKATLGGIMPTIIGLGFKFLGIKIKKNSPTNLGNEPAIYVGNHQSMLDGFALGQVLPKDILKKTYFIAISIHFQGKLKRWLARNGNIILIDKNTNLKTTLKTAAKVLKEGNNLVIFPEGARTRDGELLEFKKTFAILSKELNIPIVPFVIKGAYELMPFGEKPKAGEMELKVLDKYYPEGKNVEKITEEVKAIIAEQLK